MSSFFLTNPWGEKYIENFNRALFESRPSKEIFDRTLNVDFTLNDTLYLVVGSDSGLLIPHAGTQTAALDKANGSRIVFIEPDEIHDLIRAENPACLAWLDNAEREPDNSRTPLSLLRQSEWQDAIFNGNDTPWFLGGRVQLIQSMACEKDYTQTYTPLFRQVHTAMQDRQLALMTSLSGKSFTLKQIENAADNIQPLMTSETFGKDSTAIVLGGSPSLMDHMDWIIENRDRLFVISVSRLSEKLQRLGLVPDLVIAIDPQDYTYDVSRHGIAWPDVPLVSSYHVGPSLLRQWQGPVRFLGHRLPWNPSHSELSGSNISAGGPTVGHTATVVASQLGFTTILLCGVDLCYSSDIQTHSSDSPEALVQTLPSLYNAQVETYAGHKAGTNHLLLQSLPSLTRIGAQINKYTQVLFNLSKNAARVSTIEYRSRNDVHLPRQRPDIAQLIDKESLDRCSRIKDLNLLHEEVRQARQKCLLIQRSCVKAESIITRMYDPARSERFASSNRKLEKLDKSMERNASACMLAIRRFAGLELVALKKPSGFDAMSQDAMQEWIRSYYATLARNTDRFVEMIDELLPRIQLRLDECNPDVPVAQLLERWAQDKSPGRVLTWLKWSGAQLNSADRALVDAAAQRFLDSLADSDTPLARKLKDNNQDIDNCLRSLLYVFSQGSRDDLVILSDRLNAQTWPSSPLRSFTRGLCAELVADHAAALQCYNEVIDGCSDRLASTGDTLESLQRIIEESLVRMTQSFLALKDRDSACQTLGTLCEMLPQYMVSYARLLNLCGNQDSAIELLQVYLENFPQNWRATLLLAEIYEAKGEPDKASEARASCTQRQSASNSPENTVNSRKDAA